MNHPPALPRFLIFVSLQLLFILPGINPDLMARASSEVSGIISSDTTWSADTVKITGTILIEDSATLTITPGVRVVFQGHYMFRVWGTLLAQGTKDSMITFTIHDTTGFHDWDTTLGGWNKIFIHNGSRWGGANGAMDDNDTSRIEYCRIEHSKCDDIEIDEWSFAGGAITVIGFTRLIVANCEISNNRSMQEGGGISCKKGADFIIRNNLIKNNQTRGKGGGIYCWTANPLITGNEITYNKSLGDQSAGGGIHCEFSEARIYNNLVSNNQTVHGGNGINLSQSRATVDRNTITYNSGLQPGKGSGGGIHIGYSNDRIINNLISNNSKKYGGGVEISSSSIEFINNLVINNLATQQGGGVSLRNSQSLVLNNTIANNHAGQEGGGIFLADSRPLIINNIIWGNTASGAGAQAFFNEWYSRPDIINCNIQGGESALETGGPSYDGHIENLLNSHPAFVSPTNVSDTSENGAAADWYLEDHSDCINAGNLEMVKFIMPETDISGWPRVSYGRVDIGAYEVKKPSIEISGTFSTDTTLYADTIKVTGDVIIEDNATMTINPGSRVEFQGNYMLDVDGTLLAVGLEASPILFTRDDSAGFYRADTLLGCWKGIRFDNGGTGSSGAMSDNDSSVLEYCTIQYVKTKMEEAIDNKGSIGVNYFSNLRISHCNIRNNHTYEGGAIYCYKSNLRISDNIIENNRAQYMGGIHCISSNIVLQNNLVMNNTGGIDCSDSKVLIDKNIIYGNSQWIRGAGLMLNSCHGMVSNNRFLNNDGLWGGAMCCQGGFSAGGLLRVYNNVFSNNRATLGGAIAIFDMDNAVLLNNTICYNLTEGNQNHRGALAIGNSSPVFMNNIFWGNKDQDGVQILVQDKTSFPEFYFNNIQDGILGIHAYYTDMYRGPFENNIDTLPHFESPPDSAGPGFNGLNADYSLYPLSGCINSGNPDTNELFMPVVDILGHPRIHNLHVDIGAVENQDEEPLFLDQPGSQILCEGDSASLQIRVSDTVFYQWYHNGMKMPGANASSLRFDSITLSDEGNYECIIQNAYKHAFSNEVYLLVKKSPEILGEPESRWLGVEKPFTFRVFAEGSQPMQYSWKKDGVDLQERDVPEFTLMDPNYSDEGIYQCFISNSCGTDSTTPATIFIAPQLCMVTVSTTTGKNLVIWEKNSSAPIKYYNIYRESDYANIYDLLASVPYNDLSVIVDSTADPTVQAYLYKITAVDTNDRETDIELSTTHKTIHLLATKNPETGATQLDWDRYVGFEYGNYEVYRSDTSFNFSMVHSMSSSTSTWTDASPGEGDQFYRIAAVRPVPCVPEGPDKAGTGPVQHALSNMDNNKKLASSSKELHGEFEVKVFPNPFSDHAVILFSGFSGQPFEIRMTDLSGRIVRHWKRASQREVEITRDALPSGFYLIEVRSDRIFRTGVVIR